jgi:hypothetical protein
MSVTGSVLGRTEGREKAKGEGTRGKEDQSMLYILEDRIMKPNKHCLKRAKG